MAVDQVQGLTSSPNWPDRELSIERRELSTMRRREGQQIAVRHLSRRSDLCGIDRAVAEEADVIGPEAIAPEQTELADDLRGHGRADGALRITRQFGKTAGRERGGQHV